MSEGLRRFDTKVSELSVREQNDRLERRAGHTMPRVDGRCNEHHRNGTRERRTISGGDL
jgi:hypothetical protein